NRGQHGKSSIFVGFSFSPLSPKGSSSHFCENIRKTNFQLNNKSTHQLKSNCPQKNFYQPLSKRFKAPPQNKAGSEGQHAPAEFCNKKFKTPLKFLGKYAKMKSSGKRGEAYYA
ncbi:MAG: hypothetical protein ACI4XA_05325, partial [Oscillospiraceae bacterium]